MGVSSSEKKARGKRTFGWRAKGARWLCAGQLKRLKNKALTPGFKRPAEKRAPSRSR